MAHIDDADTQRANLAFIKRSMRAPMLTRDREYELAVAWREHGDQTALHELVSSYTRLVISTASRFRNYGLPIGDLVQEGNVGLMQAAARFEPERGVRFSTYAAWWIRSQMQDFILRNWSIVRTGTTAAQKALFFNLRRLKARLGEPSDGEDRRRTADRIAGALRVSVSEVEEMEGRLSAPDQSLNATVGIEGDEEWQDFLSDERPNPEDVAAGTLDTHVVLQLLAEALAELSPRERSVIKGRRLTDDGSTLEELGRELGVSKERVRQIEQRALTKLRHSITRRVREPTDLLPVG